MDWKRFIDTIGPISCVLSVEKKPGGGYGAIRIVTGNKGYLDSLALAAGGVDLDSDKKTEFIPNSEYTRYIPKDLNFEDVCYRCAVLKQPIHNCVRAERYSFHINVFMLPLESDDENLGYCTFSQVLLQKDDDNLMTMNISMEIARDVISTCIKLQGDKPFQEIMQEVVTDIREICGAEYCCVLLMDGSRRTCSVLGEAKSPDSELGWSEDYMDEGFYDLAESWQETIGGSFCLTIRDTEDLEYVRQRNPKWHASLTDTHVQRLVLYPLHSRGQLLGYIWATNFREEDTLRIKDTLELTTFFIASEIANHRFIEQLRLMGKMDMLTGVMNRNAMNERITTLSAAAEELPGRMGIVFADLNGLKRVNDHQGHLAGDLLLKNAAVILQSTFNGAEIYRAGGDEFLILLSPTDEADVLRKIEEVRKKSGMFENVSFSVGYSLFDNGARIRTALSEADAAMYADKEEYYRRGGYRR